MPANDGKVTGDAATPGDGAGTCSLPEPDKAGPEKPPANAPKPAKTDPKEAPVSTPQPGHD